MLYVIKVDDKYVSDFDDNGVPILTDSSNEAYRTTKVAAILAANSTSRRLVSSNVTVQEVRYVIKLNDDNRLGSYGQPHSYAGAQSGPAILTRVCIRNAKQSAMELA